MKNCSVTCLATLMEFERQPFVYLEDVPPEIRPALHNFIVGETLTVINGKVRVPGYMFRLWMGALLDNAESATQFGWSND